jgi:hypothetical protein
MSKYTESKEYREGTRQHFLTEKADHMALLTIGLSDTSMNESMAKIKEYEKMKRKSPMIRAELKSLRQDAMYTMMSKSVLQDCVKNKGLLNTHVNEPEKLEEMRKHWEEGLAEYEDV